MRPADGARPPRWHSRARAAVNRRYAQFAIRRAQRAQRVRGFGATLILANHWSGSVQQFYHFLLGYFGPAAIWLRDHPGERIWLRDCGPMNVWLDAIRPDVAVTVVPAGTALNVLIGGRRHVRIVRGLDDPVAFDRRRLHAAVDAIAWLIDVEGAVADRSPTGVDAARVIVIDRSSSEDFYRTDESETHMSGSERRSTPNLAEVIAGLPFVEPVAVVDTARLSPVEQVRTFAAARAVVGQHGAGLAHMLWLPPGSVVVEIQPPLVDGVDHIFAELARALGHTYVVVAQDDVHAPVDPATLADGLRRAGLLRD